MNSKAIYKNRRHTQFTKLVFIRKETVKNLIKTYRRYKIKHKVFTMERIISGAPFTAAKYSVCTPSAYPATTDILLRAELK